MADITLEEVVNDLIDKRLRYHGLLDDDDDEDSSGYGGYGYGGDYGDDE